MKVLGGERVVFYPAKGNNHSDQLKDCLCQIDRFCESNQVYKGCFIKHTIFIESSSLEFGVINQLLSSQLRRNFPSPQLIAVVAQSPTEHLLIVESTYIDSQKWMNSFFKSEFGMCQLLTDGYQKLCYGVVHVDSHSSVFDDSVKAFQNIEVLLEKCGLSMDSIVRQWNYIERITDFDGNVQRYQAFNDVRSDFYSDYFQNNGYPAATGIGTNEGGVVIEFLAVESQCVKSEAIANPRQKDAYLYDNKLLIGERSKSHCEKTTPKFERARYLMIDNHGIFYVSGTASIKNEHSVAHNNIEEQLNITLDNMSILLSKSNLKTHSIEVDEEVEINYARIYIKCKLDFGITKKIAGSKLANAELLFLIADVCRDELLVEIEAEAHLTRKCKFME